MNLKCIVMTLRLILSSVFLKHAKKNKNYFTNKAHNFCV